MNNRNHSKENQNQWNRNQDREGQNARPHNRELSRQNNRDRDQREQWFGNAYQGAQDDSDNQSNYNDFSRNTQNGGQDHDRNVRDQNRDHRSESSYHGGSQVRGLNSPYGAETNNRTDGQQFGTNDWNYRQGESLDRIPMYGTGQEYTPTPSSNADQRRWNSGSDSIHRGMKPNDSSDGNRNESPRGEFVGRGPKGYRRSDQRIEEEVCEALTADDRIDAEHIEISVSAGTVILSGTVTERRIKRMAEEVVENCRGVDDVQNNIRVQNRDDTSDSANDDKNLNSKSNHKDLKNVKDKDGKNTSSSTSLHS